MLAAVRSAAVLGIDAYDVTVEVDAALGLPAWTIVGLAAGAVRESRERVNAAIVNAGFTLPPRRVTVNLAPADTPKSGTAFDLPIAIALLMATSQLPSGAADGLTIVGELGLDGAIRSVRGALPLARHVVRTRGQTLVLPPSNVAEASLVSSLRIVALDGLASLVGALKRRPLPAPPTVDRWVASPPAAGTDFSEVAGQQTAKRALEVAAAGGHNVLLLLTSRPCSEGASPVPEPRLRDSTRPMGEPTLQEASTGLRRNAGQTSPTFHQVTYL
jgi:magnesium chelatase family protein